MLGGLKAMIRNWLNIQEAPNRDIIIQERFNFETNAIKNEIWMRGDPYEIEQFYKQMDGSETLFWASVPYIKIRKIHTGIPQLIVKCLTSIVLNDLNDVELSQRQLDWDNIEHDNGFKKVLKQAIQKALYLGDGAFKLSIVPSVTPYPIIEFYGANKVDIKYTRGRFKECVFKTRYTHDKKTYTLLESYGFGYVSYELHDHLDRIVSLNTIPQTEMLQNVIFSKDFCMAVPLMIYESSKWEHRGRSIFDGKESDFDAIDEVFSQWMDALRASRPQKYIPKVLLPRDPNTGYVENLNDFDNRFIQTESDMSENGKNDIRLIQPTIPSGNYLESYITALDACLQGIISPSTLGIDVKKLDNAEAQREKEKTTLYTRNDIIVALQECLPKLVNATLKAYDTARSLPLQNDVEVSISFGEYANPSFEAVVETISKARTNKLMSIEAMIDELYGDTKDEEWKHKEIERIKSELGIAEVDEPLIENVGDFN